jgi:hypothetical protein
MSFVGVLSPTVSGQILSCQYYVGYGCRLTYISWVILVYANVPAMISIVYVSQNGPLTYNIFAIDAEGALGSAVFIHGYNRRCFFSTRSY